MKKAIIIGASGYSGAELVKILSKHPQIEVSAIYVSEQSQDKNKYLSQLYPQLKNISDLQLKSLKIDNLAEILTNIDLAFLATDHAVSLELAPKILAHKVKVFDLSGAFRVPCLDFYPKYYGFTHADKTNIQKAIYGLCEYNYAQIKDADFISLPGCYPTVSQLCLRPLLEANIINTNFLPVINAVSGVSGAGRKASLNNNFCEVSLKAYGIFNHRHQPEISHHLQQEIIFTPHLGNFKRGILATITAQINPCDPQKIAQIYQQAYKNQPLIRIYPEGEFTSINAVENTPFCDISFAIKDNHIIIIGAIDNLVKGAAGQAVQAANICYGFEQTQGLL